LALKTTKVLRNEFILEKQINFLRNSSHLGGIQTFRKANKKISGRNHDAIMSFHWEEALQDLCLISQVEEFIHENVREEREVINPKLNSKSK